MHIRSGDSLTSWQLSGALTTDPRDSVNAEPQKSHTDDFINFEGLIGNSIVYLWDRGKVEASSPKANIAGSHPVEQGLSAGELNLVFNGVKLRGSFRMYKKSAQSKHWLLSKVSDRFATNGNTFRFSEGSVKSDKTFTHDDLANPESLQIWDKTGHSRYQQSNTVNTITRKIGFIPTDKQQRLSAFESAVISKNIKISFSKLEKVLYPTKGITKGDLLAYYYFMSPVVLTYLKDRPLISRRYPNGVHEPAALSTSGGRLPPWIRTMSLFTGSGSEKKSFILTDSEKTLLYLTNHSAIEHFTWSSSAGSLDEPDFGCISVIPSKCPAKLMIRTALSVKQALEDFGLYPVCKTTGKGYGLEVYFPLTEHRNYDDLNKFCELFVDYLHKKIGDSIALKSEDAPGRVWLRADMNKKNKPFVMPYSLRAIDWAGVSAPLEWSELESGYKPPAYNFETIFERLQKIGDPFAAILSEQGDLATALERLKAARARIGMIDEIDKTG
jgi:DNA ligase D-like protein (predicted polymerase)